MWLQGNSKELFRTNFGSFGELQTYLSKFYTYQDFQFILTLSLPAYHCRLVEKLTHICVMTSSKRVNHYQRLLHAHLSIQGRVGRLLDDSIRGRELIFNDTSIHKSQLNLNSKTKLNTQTKNLKLAQSGKLKLILKLSPFMALIRFGNNVSFGEETFIGCMLAIHWGAFYHL